MEKIKAQSIYFSYISAGSQYSTGKLVVVR
jgi:hypothetical protein